MARKQRSNGGEKSVVCTFPDCGKSFSKSKSRHRQTHIGKPYRCELCEEHFCRKDSLTFHLITHREKPHFCDWPGCRMRFSQAGQLNQHHEKHTIARPHVCTRCDERFLYRSVLKRHERKHTGEKPHVCELPNCGMRFSWKGALNKHRRIHTEEKLYSCEGCGKVRHSLNRSDDLLIMSGFSL
jgi:KRAB domain-containing zinc finger protein